MVLGVVVTAFVVIVIAEGGGWSSVMGCKQRGEWVLTVDTAGGGRRRCKSKLPQHFQLPF